MEKLMHKVFYSKDSTNDQATNIKIYHAFFEEKDAAELFIKAMKEYDPTLATIALNGWRWKITVED